MIKAYVLDEAIIVRNDGFSTITDVQIVPGSVACAELRAGDQCVIRGNSDATLVKYYDSTGTLCESAIFLAAKE